MPQPTRCIIAIVSAVTIAGGILSADDLDPGARGNAVVEQWCAASQTVSGVRGTVELFTYDLVSRTQSQLTGEFGYLGEQHGFLRLRNAEPLLASHLDLAANDARSFQLIDSPPSHIRWNGDCFRVIDDEARTYHQWKLLRYPLTESGKAVVDGLTFAGRFDGTVGFWKFEMCQWMDCLSPFLPGMPNKAVASNFDFAMVEENELQVRLKATPKRESKFRVYIRNCELLFDKGPLRLLARVVTNAVMNRTR